MALIDDQMAVVGDNIRDLSFAHQALDERYVNDARRLSFSAANNADLFLVYLQKGSQTLHPLVEQLSSVDQDECVPSTVRNQSRPDDRLAKGGRRGKHPILMGDENVKSLQLRPSQFALEGYVRGKRRADFAQIFQIGNGAMAFDEVDCFL
jgi:hypothetical protein